MQKTKFKFAFILALSSIVFLLHACDQQPTSSHLSNLQPTQDTVTPDHAPPDKQITPTHEIKHQANTKANPAPTTKALDLTWKNTLTAPTIKEQHILPNLFEKKQAEAKKASLSGKFYRNDDPQIPLFESIEGAEVSVKVRIP